MTKPFSPLTFSGAVMIKVFVSKEKILEIYFQYAPLMIFRTYGLNNL